MIFIKFKNVYKSKYLSIKKYSEQAKQEAIEFKLAHDQITGNQNGYPV